MGEFRNPFDRPESPGTDEPAAQQPASATGVFGKPAAPANRPPQEDVLASLAREKNLPVTGSGERTAASPAPPALEPPNSGAPGEFTRMLQTFKSPPSASAPGSKPAQDLASIFKQVSLEKPPERADIPPPAPRPFAPSAQKAGEDTQPVASEAIPTSFTQMFSTPAAKAPQTQPTAPPATLPSAAQNQPGEFTRLFQSVQTQGDTASRSPAAPAPASPELSRTSEPASSTEPGAFTQMFSKPAVPPQIAQRDEPGSFTQMFSQPAVRPMPQETPFPPLRPESRTDTRPDPRPETRPERSFGFSPAPNVVSEPPLPAQGGFTQLFRALSQEESASAKQSDPLPPLAPPAAAPSAQGGFTQLLQSLSPQPSSSPAAPPPMQPLRPAAPPPVSSGPGEFTRVISGSAFREGQGAPPMPPAAAPVSAPGGESMAGRPAFPAAMPPIPSAAPHIAPPAFAFPPAATPQPAPPPAAPPQTSLQKYLPLILLVNVFLLLVIVLILVFVLRHH